MGSERIDEVLNPEMVGNTAKVARDDLEKKLKESVVTRNNELSYKYIDDNIQIENKSEK